jgi:dTDP-4-amino-4,6-dideoxygalactose transaminase
MSGPATSRGAARLGLPLARPRPARLSRLGAALEAIEESGHFSNYGPVNARLEQAFLGRMFAGTGACVTVCNATIGLMLALRQAARTRPGGRNLAVMPSFTFAAMAHAALWAGLTPFLVDIDPDTWLPSAEAEEAALRAHGADVAVLFPYATFGNTLDLARYERLARAHGVPVVVDAAASLGSVAEDGRAFGTGFSGTLVFSMHATKAFSTGEAGLIYSADAERIATLRCMGNYGFGQPRAATMPGLNAKLSEVAALLGLAKLEEFETVVRHRARLAACYRAQLAGWRFQALVGRQHAYQFMPVLLPAEAAHRRAEIIAGLAQAGIGAGSYFSPHIARQPYFAQMCAAGRLAATEQVARRILALPISDTMSEDDVAVVCDALRAAVAGPAARAGAEAARPRLRSLRR